MKIRKPTKPEDIRDDQIKTGFIHWILFSPKAMNILMVMSHVVSPLWMLLMMYIMMLIQNTTFFILFGVMLLLASWKSYKFFKLRYKLQKELGTKMVYESCLYDFTKDMFDKRNKK